METAGSGTIGSPPVPSINVARCSGCGRCVAACPLKIITLETVGHRKNAVLLCEERCACCGRCVENCPVGAFDW
ncbi:MAG: 4Fe-4S dicluster domain-containing protein [Steroidobacteraceae bacterium]|nr:4Fe-4S dicluster domain-containing protein [Deltaproteobacteria bacterium]